MAAASVEASAGSFGSAARALPSFMFMLSASTENVGSSGSCSRVSSLDGLIWGGRVNPSEGIISLGITLVSLVSSVSDFLGDGIIYHCLRTTILSWNDVGRYFSAFFGGL